jgi:hypothetical protein
MINVMFSGPFVSPFATGCAVGWKREWPPFADGHARIVRSGRRRTGRAILATDQL